MSPEQSTSQDYHYMACTLYIMNVYKELLGINLSANGYHYGWYSNKYKGKRKEVI
ncbi:hypothetical protein J5751_02245 [bacterium]|nr:hypothetical protein [bacterium]